MITDTVGLDQLHRLRWLNLVLVAADRPTPVNSTRVTRLDRPILETEE